MKSLHLIFHILLLGNRVAPKYTNSNGDCDIPKSLREEILNQQPIVTDILNQIVNGKYAGDTYNSLEYFCDQFGPRMSGSKNLENSIDYLVTKFTEVGLDNAHTENAPVPRWERGTESAELISPHTQNLVILGLGDSVSTPRFGLVSSAVVVESFDEFANISDNDIRGKIAIFVPKWKSYAETGIYRRTAAAEAAKRGAIAALVRSVTQYSIGSPHTGSQSYENGVKKIPVASLTVEDAEMLLRLYRRGEKIVIRLKMYSKQYKPAMSRNAIGELYGTNSNVNESVVVLSGHIDSWDVGVGALDDGGGSFVSWKALQYLRMMNYRAKRTLRAIMWTGEEQGIWGAQAYAKEHREREDREFNFFFELDGGIFNPAGLLYRGNSDGACIFEEILKLMTPINATNFAVSGGGPDINIWLDRGFPGGTLMDNNDNDYWWYHHSYGDSILVQNSTKMDIATALFAATSYVIANLSIDMPRDFLV